MLLNFTQYYFSLNGNNAKIEFSKKDLSEEKEESSDAEDTDADLDPDDDFLSADPHLNMSLNDQLINLKKHGKANLPPLYNTDITPPPKI